MKDVTRAEVALLLGTALEPVPPAPAVRARLMAAVEGPARYLPFCVELSLLFDLTETRMRELLARIDVSAMWKPGVAPVEGSLNFRPGPGLTPLHGGFVRLLGGAGFPLHRHGDREVTFVLSGHIYDDAGMHFGPGNVIDMPSGSVHSLSVTDDAPALLAVLSGAIEMLG